MTLTRIAGPHTWRVVTATSVSGNVNLTGEGSFYQTLAPGYHRVTVVSGTPGQVHIATAASGLTRYISESFDVSSAATVAVTVPQGKEHYLNVQLSAEGSVRVLMEHLATP